MTVSSAVRLRPVAAGFEADQEQRQVPRLECRNLGVAVPGRAMQHGVAPAAGGYVALDQLQHLHELGEDQDLPPFRDQLLEHRGQPRAALASRTRLSIAVRSAAGNLAGDSSGLPELDRAHQAAFEIVQTPQERDLHDRELDVVCPEGFQPARRGRRRRTSVSAVPSPRKPGSRDKRRDLRHRARRLDSAVPCSCDRNRKLCNQTI